MKRADPPIILRETGSLGRITLNRPRAINALTLDMVQTMRAALQDWRADSGIGSVLIDGAGERGLCAGGDIRAAWDSIRDGAGADLFWDEEYRLLDTIACYPKPVVAWMDGLVMGGGVGISAHASHRIVTERSAVAMPETIIGFTPDVGGSYLLSRAPGQLGLRLGLTGGRMSAGDAIHCGFADHCMASDRLTDLAAALRATGADAAIAALAAPPPASPLATHRSWVDAAYAAPSMLDIVTALRARPEPEAADDVAALARRSPTALAVTLRSIRAARALPGLAACLAQERRLVRHMLRQPDFAEGVRAQVIDKDRNPCWRPARLEDVDAGRLEAWFGAADVASDTQGGHRSPGS
ncbi:enoyl-CoA hydratase/isomerase family protein [Lichenicoccus sp.]|uniref:enoyl-CoA hydratase/isomerase family protein n=1 Tax=Lichenicoccus sp. TaxID=2781899 RepID=UPI003D09A71F